MSWVHSASAEGFDLFFSRDESRTRGPERPPQEFETEGVRYLAPTDTDAGGTWVCVNEFGLGLGLLNGYHTTRGEPRDPYRSRGRLVRELAKCASPTQAFDLLTPEHLAPYRPLVLLAIGPTAPAQILRWDGLEIGRSRESDSDLPLSSSGVDPLGARTRRVELLAASRARHAGDELAALHDFHTGVGVEPDSTSACMSRADAETRSLVHIAVRLDGIRIAHAPGRPDSTPLGEPQHLPRRTPR